MSLNFNVDPYYDDFDPTKNYHRIVFKPGFAVQARELTQSQTILQNQISNFADHIFSQNTPVKGGKVTTNLNCYYLKLNSTYNGAVITASNFLNKVIQDGQTGSIIAKVIATTEGVINGDPPTLIVTYLSGQRFTDGASLVTNDGSNIFATVITSTTGNPSTGLSSTASISEGIFYIVNGYSKSSTQNPDGTYSTYSIGNFVSVAPQTIILDKYSSTPSYRIGLEINETIVDYVSDSSLLDPAVGASNYQAPGADRYRVSLTLTQLPLTFGSDNQFIELLRVDQGAIVKQSDNTVYSVIDDYFAKRDYETNGDYVVEDFKITPTPRQPDPATWNLGVSKGVAYVHGYRVENQGQVTLNIPRAQTYDTINNNTFNVDYSNYFVTDTLKGIFDFTTMPTVDLHCVQASSINSTNANTYNSTLVATGFIRNLVYQSSTGSNTKSYVFNTYLNNINTITLNGSVLSGNTANLRINDTGGNFSAVANAYYGTTLVITSGTDAGDRRNIVSYDGTSKTITVSQPFTVTPDNTSKFSLIFSTADVESIVQKNGSYALTANTNINTALGKTNSLGMSDTIFNACTAPQLVFNNSQIGYAKGVANTQYYSTQIFRNQAFSYVSNQLTISVSAPIAFPQTGTYYGNTFKTYFTLVRTDTGEILDFSTSANSVTVSYSSGVYTAVFNSPSYTTATGAAAVVDVFAQVHIVNGESSSSILKTKTVITGNTNYVSTLSAVTGVSNTTINLTSGQTYIQKSAIGTGPISLYVNDVKQIKKIIATSSATVTPTAGSSLANYTDVTNRFSLNNGQTDNFYDHASIQLLPGVNAPVGNILVVYDYYQHGGGDGYFTINSYGITEAYSANPTYTSKNGTLYNLRDVIDFRPSRQNAQNAYIWEYQGGASIGNILIPVPGNSSQVQNNYSYYLGRKDKLVLTKDSQLINVQGTPAVNPVLPNEPDGSLVLANITLNPYTATIPGNEVPGVGVLPGPYDVSINKVLHKRWAKSDISDLQKQVDNLEYYTSLSALESNAQALQVLDANGLNRFKNGILVDDFSSFGVAETANPGYSANINIRKKQLTAISDVQNFQLQNPYVLASYGTLANTNNYAISSLKGTQTNLFTLPYKTANLIVQQLASNTVSINPFSVAIQQGTATLNPPMDNWVNTIMTPAILITDPNMQFNQTYGGNNLLNSGDFASVPGTTTLVGAQSSASATQSYVSQLSGLLNAEQSSAASSALISADGYVTNTQVLPYIRPQEIIVRAQGMLVNTPVSCFFDGRNVNKYITAPNTMELSSVAGKFNEDDIVGFYEADISTFFPIGRVVSVYNYPDGIRTRLYISKLVGAPGTVSTTNLINAGFDQNGTYVPSTTTANGTVVFANNSYISVSTSGDVTGVGGGFTSIANPTTVQNIYKTPTTGGWPEFMNTYAVWGDPNNSSTYTATYPVTFTSAGTYTITAAGSVPNGGSSSTIAVQGLGNVLSLTNYATLKSTTITVGSAATLNVSWSIVNAYTGVPGYNAGFAMKIVDGSGNVVFNSLSPDGITYGTASSTYSMPGGGKYYMGATKIQLDQHASSANGFYVGTQISVRSMYVYEYQVAAVYQGAYPTLSGDGDCWNVANYWARVATYNAAYSAAASLSTKSTIWLNAGDTALANITAYNGATRTATLDAPVNISLGYNSQYGQVNSKYNIIGNVGSLSQAIHAGNTIPQLSTNEKGQFVGVFNIPGSDFFIGQRTFRVDNRTTDGDAASATTYAEATFVASGLQITNSQNFSPSVDSSSTLLTPISQQNYNIISHTSPYDPIAQTFIVDKDNYKNGVFLKSIKLFFAPYSTSVLPTSDVTVSIVGTLNGYPNGKTLDYSTVTKSAGDIKVSKTPHYLDANTSTEFVFDAPVYIQSGVLYAIVITSNSSEYNLYYGQQNQLAIASTGAALPGQNTTNPTKIGAAPYVGALFESQNAITWTADQTKDLMFVIDQCIFDTTVQPTIPFNLTKNLPYRKLGREDIMHNLSSNNVTGVYGQFGTTQPMHAMNLTTTDFVASNTNINYQYQATLQNGFTSTGYISTSPGKFGAPTQDNIYFEDGQGPRILLDNSNSSFQLVATLKSNDANVSPIIADDGVSVYRVANFINNMGIDTAVISVPNGGSGYGPNTTITISSPDVGSNTPVLGYTANANGSILSVYASYPGSGYLNNPTITINDPTTRSGNANAVVQVTGENSPVAGNGYARYITKRVTLTTGNDSGDLRVYYTAYKPIGTQVYVYYRILSSADGNVKLEDQSWQLMTQVNNPTKFSSPGDRSPGNMYEYECAPGINNLANNNISYTSTSGQTYTNFIQFAIKVVLASSDPTLVPVLTDIRALALPSGTGI
jgi:hypothetical protein